MKTLFLFIVSFSLLTLISFQNEFKPAPGQTRIKKITNLQTGNYVEYFYNPDGRIASHYSSVNPKMLTAYKYSGNRIVKIPPTINNSNPTIDTFYLDNSGLATEIRSGVGMFSDYVTRVEFKNGYMVKGVHYSNNAVTFMEENIVVNGNIVEIRRNSPDKTIQSDGRISSFYTDRPNTTGNEERGESFRGKSSKNPVKSTFRIGEKGDTLIINTKKYQYDEKQRIILSVAYDAKNVMTDSTGYTYY